MPQILRITWIDMEPQFLVDLAMREYESLRGEVLVTVERQYSLAQWSVSAIAVIVAAVFGGWQTLASISYLITVILLFVVPVLITVYVVTWSHTITKIHQLGSRLHQIEENIASAISRELIQRTFGVAADSDVPAYKYTVGWEHRLWKGGVNLRVQTTVLVVGRALAAVYASVIALNVLFMLKVEDRPPSSMAWLTALAAAVWAIVWWLVFRYVRERNRF